MEPKDRAFPKYARDYFEQLRGQYQLLLEQTPQQQPTASIATLIADAKQHLNDVSWSDVFTLESAYLFAIIDSGGVERLRAEVILARNRLRDVIGASEYLTYEKVVPADVTTMTPAQLGAELMALAERIRYLYTFVPPKESVRNKMAIDAALWTMGAALLGIAIYLVAEWRYQTALVTILVVLFVGQMGGFLSVQQRLQGSGGVDPLFKELQLSNGWFSVVVISPISGGLFAVVLYFMFVGGLMSGGLFPRFGPSPAPTVIPVAVASAAAATTVPATGPTALPAPAPTPCPPTAACSPISITQFFVRAEPTGIEDWGKLLVWAFIAGFAERFVPDVLTRLTGGPYSVASEKPSGGTTVSQVTGQRNQGTDGTRTGPGNVPRSPTGSDPPKSENTLKSEEEQTSDDADPKNPPAGA